MEKINKIEKYPFVDSFWPSWLSWKRTSFQSLSISESKLFNYVKNQYNLSFVSICNNAYYLRTLFANKVENADKSNENKIPIVMIHGLCSGIGLWCKNIDSISNNRKLYAMDLLGFGFSSRPKFSNDPVQVENLFIDSIEEWRKSLGLKQFILLGHSLGGFIVCSYAIKYPQNVSHLILVDPWGFNQFDESKLCGIRKNFFTRFIFSISPYFNPLGIVRGAGPLGPSLIRFRKDIGLYFEGDKNMKTSDNNVSVDSNDVFEYIYHCNAQHPSGEPAFKTLSSNVIWSYNPMINRALELDKSIRVSFIYGSETWMDTKVGKQFKDKRPESFVDVQFIKGCGHHVYAECADEFNQMVNDICETVDSTHADDPVDDEPVEKI